MSDREKQDAMYADEPWAKLAVLAGYRPYDTESGARGAFRSMEDMFVLLTEINQAEIDGDGDVILGADEYGFNETLYRIGTFLKTQKPLQIEVFPMTEEGTLAETLETTKGWDIILRFDGCDPLHEFEDLSLKARDVKVAMLTAMYPFANLDWSCVELLQ